MSDYQSVFKLTTQNILSKACKYILGLFASEKGKRNIERMVEQNGEDYQSQQHFMTDSPWDAREAMKVVAQKANKSLGPASKQSLNIDECSNKKAGRHSVGVSRQHNGNLGKIENSQTGVYASLGSGNNVCLVNCRLFLPKVWAEEQNRCKRAGIPPEDTGYKTKPELAIDMIKEMDGHGIDYGWIGADGLYGSSYSFWRSLDELGKKFVVDVHRDQQVYLEEPKLLLPEKKGAKGRSYQKLRTDSKPVELQQYVESLQDDGFTELKFRKGTKGWIRAQFHMKQVWVWDKKENRCRKRTLVGMVADDPDNKIELKAFHCEILNDHQALKTDQESYKDIEVIRKLDYGMAQRNYFQIKQYIQYIIQF